MKMIRSIVTVMLVALPSCHALAQTHEEEGGRYRFAQTYVGADLQLTGGGATTLASDDGLHIESVELPARLTPRLTIGGLHFWGHAEFYVTFPTVSFTRGGDVGSATSFSTGTETGARIYPWGLHSGSVRPFAGIAWEIGTYAQDAGEEEGPALYRHRVRLQAGGSWHSQAGIVQAGIGWALSRALDYPIARNLRSVVDLPQLSGWLGYNYCFDATAPLEPLEKSGDLARIERALGTRGDLNSFAVAAGFSSAFPMSRSSHNLEARPYLDDRVPSIPFPDVGIGYYRYDLDAAINLSLRPMTQVQSGYGVEQRMTRTALSLEAMKFLADYNGFVPFIGLTFGREWLRVTESDAGAKVADLREERWAPGIIAGWDIRPTRFDWWLLRTNLRYTPDLSLSMPEGRRAMFDHLEINFIQMVVYPERLLD